MAEITEVRITLINQPDSKLKALATITLDDEWAIHGVRVVEGEKGLFVALPARKAESGEYLDVAHPVCKEARDELIAEVLAAYSDEVERAQQREERRRERRNKAGA